MRELVDRKRGRPLLLGYELDVQVQAYVNALRLNGGVVNTTIVIATGEGCRKKTESLIFHSLVQIYRNTWTPQIIYFNFAEIFGPPGTKISEIFGSS